MAEQAEGAPLLREYRVQKLYRGFESLSHRHLLYHAPVAQLDRVLGYEPSGQRFESSRVRHFSFLSLFSLNFLNKIFVDFNPFSDYDRTYFYLINLIFLC